MVFEVAQVCIHVQIFSALNGSGKSDKIRFYLRARQ